MKINKLEAESVVKWCLQRNYLLISSPPHCWCDLRDVIIKIDAMVCFLLTSGGVLLNSFNASEPLGNVHSLGLTC